MTGQPEQVLDSLKPAMADYEHIVLLRLARLPNQEEGYRVRIVSTCCGKVVVEGLAAELDEAIRLAVEGFEGLSADEIQ